MNQKELEQANKKRQNHPSISRIIFLQYSHSISALSVLILKRKLQNTFQRWQSKDITHDKKKKKITASTETNIYGML